MLRVANGKKRMKPYYHTAFVAKKIRNRNNIISKVMSVLVLLKPQYHK
jgi:hypothetical protein